MGSGAAAAVAVRAAETRTVQVAKRLRRMTPLERTRILPPVGEAEPDVPGRARPSWVLVRTGPDELGAAVPPVGLSDTQLIAARARARLVASVYALGRWLELMDVSEGLALLLPTFCEVWAVVLGRNADDFAELLETFWDAYVHRSLYGGPNPFTTTCARAEAMGLSHPKQDLETVEEIDVELTLYRLTGAWGLDLDDEQLVDALNAAENPAGGQTALDALAAFLKPLGKVVRFVGDDAE